jgi:hypothetical protein
MPARHPGKLRPQALPDAGVEQIEKIAVRNADVRTAELMAELGVSGKYLKLGVQDNQSQARLPEKRHRGLHGGIGRTGGPPGIISWPRADFIPDSAIDAFGEKINANHITPTIGRVFLNTTRLLGRALEANP